MEFADTIFMIDNADVVFEDSNIFLKYLCSSCIRKLQTLPSKPIDMSYIAEIFKEHNGSCSIFSFTSSVVTYLNLCYLSLTENDFFTYRESSSCRRINVRQKMKRMYCKQY